MRAEVALDARHAAADEAEGHDPSAERSWPRRPRPSDGPRARRRRRTRAVSAAARGRGGGRPPCRAGRADAALLAAEERLAERAPPQPAGDRRVRAARGTGGADARAADSSRRSWRRPAQKTDEPRSTCRRCGPRRPAAEAAERREPRTRPRPRVEAQPRADQARRRASELAEKVGAMRGELEGLQERAEGGGRLGSSCPRPAGAALLDGIDAPDNLAGDRGAGRWRAGAGAALARGRAGRAAGRRSGIGTLVARRRGRRGPPTMAGGALEAVARHRTLAEWLGGGRGPVALRRTAWRRTSRRCWRLAGVPAGWLAVTPEGDLADARGLVVLRGRGDRRVARRATMAGDGSLPGRWRGSTRARGGAAVAARASGRHRGGTRPLKRRRASREAAEAGCGWRRAGGGGRAPERAERGRAAASLRSSTGRGAEPAPCRTGPRGGAR